MVKLLQLFSGKEGGAERFFVNLSRAFAEAGVEQRFGIRPGQSWHKDIAALGPCVTSYFRSATPGYQLFRWRIRQICQNWEPDAILAWTPRSAKVLPNWPHAMKAVRLGDYPRHLMNFANADAVVSNTPDQTRHVREMGWKRPALTISNFAREVTPEPVRRADLDTPDDAFVIVAQGRFVPRKGFDVAIRAAAQIEGAYLWLIGDGQERAALENLVRELGLQDRTRFVGWVYEPIHHLAAADAFVMPSRHEPLGNVVLEAWSAGLPIVATRSEGPSWLIRDGIDGILTALDDVDAVAQGLARLQADPTLRARLAASGRERHAAHFAKDIIVGQYLRLFAGDTTDPMPDPGL